MRPGGSVIGLGVWAAAAAAMAVSAVVLIPVRRYADRLGLLARPGGHRTHAALTPLGGGIGIYAGVVLPLVGGAVWLSVTGGGSGLSDVARGIAARRADAAWLLAAATALMLLGLADDRWQLPALPRLGAQFAIATAVVLGLDIELTAHIEFRPLTVTLSVIWIVAVINSFNMLDNMDALCGGVAAIIAASIAVVMWTTADAATDQPQYLLAALLAVVCGSSLGFLVHNAPPARIFMGDGGSYFIGFIIAVGMLMATYAGDQRDPRPHAVLSPICAMVVPMYDLATVLWIRVRAGQHPFVGDQNHLSHRLVRMGLSRRRAVATIHLITAACGLSSVLIAHVPVLQAAAVLGIVACMLLLLVLLESPRW